MRFIIQKAFDVHFRWMGSHFATLGAALVLCAAMLTPNAAYARESEHGEQNETLNCTDPKHRHSIVRSLTESLPIRKKDKARLRRVLM